MTSDTEKIDDGGAAFPKPHDALGSICVFCLDELRRGVPEDGICGHEELNAAIERARAQSTEGK